MPATSTHILDELKARHLFYQCTDEAGLRAHLSKSDPAAGGASGGVSLYNGFDPTADSLTIGNLVPIMLLRRYQHAGHTPVVLLGGATGLIGDPSGKESERSLRTPEEIAGNISAQSKIFENLLDFDAASPNTARMVNNDDWFKKIDVYTYLRDIGKHFSVNQMIARDSIKNRLTREQGISYTEFSYMLLQAYDYLHLYREQGITLQTAGADQWGNIVSGTDLIRRVLGRADNDKALAFGMTAPLLTKSDGSKFGKTESGAIWLSHKRPSGEPGTSPYAYYQFWLNTADDDIEKYLLLFTDLSVNHIADICALHRETPHKRDAQRTLAHEATSLLHSAGASENAQRASAALFSGDVAQLDAETLAEVFASVPSSNHDKASLGAGVPLVDLLPETTLCKSKREAREHLDKGAVSINGEKAGADSTLTAANLMHASTILLRRGKKAWHVTRWS